MSLRPFHAFTLRWEGSWILTPETSRARIQHLTLEVWHATQLQTRGLDPLCPVSLTWLNSKKGELVKTQDILRAVTPTFYLSTLTAALYGLRNLSKSHGWTEVQVFRKEPTRFEREL